MSPAIAIAAACFLLNAETQLSWNWERFETKLMLSELKRVVANSVDIPKHPERPILELSFRLPTNSKANRCSIPVVNRYSIVLNGANAPYADIIAPYRLVRAKFSENPTTTKVLYLKKELERMGLLKHTVDCELQQVITSTFCVLWEMVEVVPQATKRKHFKQIEVTNRSEAYPYNTLAAPKSMEKPVVITYNTATRTFSITEKVIKLQRKEERLALVAAVEAMNELKPSIKEFVQPVTAVFATNCVSFRIVNTKETDSFTIDREDVDWQGVLKTKTISKDLSNELRTNVQLCFQFY